MKRNRSDPMNGADGMGARPPGQVQRLRPRGRSRENSRGVCIELNCIQPVVALLAAPSQKPGVAAGRSSEAPDFKASLYCPIHYGKRLAEDKVNPMASIISDVSPSSSPPSSLVDVFDADVDSEGFKVPQMSPRTTSIVTFMSAQHHAEDIPDIAQPKHERDPVVTASLHNTTHRVAHFGMHTERRAPPVLLMQHSASASQDSAEAVSDSGMSPSSRELGSLLLGLKHTDTAALQRVYSEDSVDSPRSRSSSAPSPLPPTGLSLSGVCSQVLDRFASTKNAGIATRMDQLAISSRQQQQGQGQGQQQQQVQDASLSQSVSLHSDSEAFAASVRHVRAALSNQGGWSVNEDRRLVYLVTKLGEHGQWNTIAHLIKADRSPRQCEQRWVLRLKPSLLIPDNLAAIVSAAAATPLHGRNVTAVSRCSHPDAVIRLCSDSTNGSDKSSDINHGNTRNIRRHTFAGMNNPCPHRSGTASNKIRVTASVSRFSSASAYSPIRAIPVLSIKSGAGVHAVPVPHSALFPCDAVPFPAQVVEVGMTDRGKPLSAIAVAAPDTMMPPSPSERRDASAAIVMSSNDDACRSGTRMGAHHGAASAAQTGANCHVSMASVAPTLRIRSAYGSENSFDHQVASGPVSSSILSSPSSQSSVLHEVPPGWQVIERRTAKNKRYKVYISLGGQYRFRSLRAVHRFIKERQRQLQGQEQQEQQQQQEQKQQQQQQQHVPFRGDHAASDPQDHQTKTQQRRSQSDNIGQQLLTQLRQSLREEWDREGSTATQWQQQRKEQQHIHIETQILAQLPACAQTPGTTVRSQSRKDRTALFTHVLCLQYDTWEGYLDSPNRLRAVLKSLAGEVHFADLLWCSPSRGVQLDDLFKVHDRAYIEGLFTLCELVEQGIMKPLAINPPLNDAVITKGTRDAMMCAAACVIDAIDAVMDNESPVRNAFCAVRPLGHHATRAAPSKMCILNNVAIGAAHAQRCHRVRTAVIDFGSHRGSGTQSIVQQHADILFISLFKASLSGAPGDVFDASDHGKHTNVVNLPVASRSEFLACIPQVKRELARFRPNLVLLSSGFDGHLLDHPQFSLQLMFEDYIVFVRAVLEVANDLRSCQGRVVSVLEGGYTPHALAKCVVSHVHSLMKHARCAI